MAALLAFASEFGEVNVIFAITSNYNGKQWVNWLEGTDWWGMCPTNQFLLTNNLFSSDKQALTDAHPDFVILLQFALEPVDKLA